ncbi:MAG TPA: DUF4153 domain-containing protein [Candidatus Kapabacteria bacterium]|nr:DUF4153 domain-containing protein [Candidatus Kapabacteria bacterium]
MRLPSLDHLSDRAFAAFKRFPATLLNTIVGAVALIIEFESHKDGGYDPEISNYVRLGLTCLLGLPTFMAIELWLERRGERLLNHHDTPRRRSGIRVFLYLAAACLLGIFYYEYTGVETDAIQMFIFLLSAHLAVSYVAYLRRDETNGFFQFNKMLLLRILTALFYSFVLQLGLSLALLAIDKLFGVEIDPETYAQLACVLAIFNTWFFLAGVPYSLAGQEQRTDYPKGLKIFTQSVLLPLVTIYMAILYPYAVKLLIEWDLPRGWVSNPVLWFAVVGILSFLLLYPIRNESGNEWIRSFSRYYFIALLPLLVLPALGIYTRVRDYGITEPRYFVIILVLWLLGIALYFIISKRKDIRVIPITLSIVALVSSIGPTSAFSVSKANQISRLERLLEKHDLLGTKRNIKEKKLIPAEDFDEIRSIANYLQHDHEDELLEDWLRPRVPAGVVVNKLSYDTDISSVLNFGTTRGDITGSYIRFGGIHRNAQRITGYDYYIPLILGPRGTGRDTLFDVGTLNVRHREGEQLAVSNGSDTQVLTYASIFTELRTRRDSTIRAGGNPDSMSTEIHRSSSGMDLLLTLHEGSIETGVPPHDVARPSRGAPNADERSSADSTIRMWGSGALFVKTK